MQFNTSDLDRTETTTQKKNNASGLDGMLAPTPSAGKAMLQAWRNGDSNPEEKARLQMEQRLQRQQQAMIHA
jgi:hypothetical protein